MDLVACWTVDIIGSKYVFPLSWEGEGSAKWRMLQRVKKFILSLSLLFFGLNFCTQNSILHTFFCCFTPWALFPSYLRFSAHFASITIRTIYPFSFLKKKKKDFYYFCKDIKLFSNYIYKSIHVSITRASECEKRTKLINIWSAIFKSKLTHTRHTPDWLIPFPRKHIVWDNSNLKKKKNKEKKTQTHHLSFFLGKISVGSSIAVPLWIATNKNSNL